MKLSHQLYETLNINPKDLANQDEITVQNRLAAQLRAAAVAHLAHADGIVARQFRGEYLATDVSSAYQTFLQTQARNGQWATDIEAAALGELLGVHIVVTSEMTLPGKARDPQTFCIYRAADSHAPTIHLRNINDTHWYVNNNTRGNGNCLYNAVAQELHRIVCAEQPKEHCSTTASYLAPMQQVADAVAKPVVATPMTEFGLFATRNAEEDHAIAHQIGEAHIAALVAKHPTPRQLEITFEAERTRIASLPLSEQKQIADDYKLALQLATQELRSFKGSFIFATEPQPQSILCSAR